MLLLSQFLFKCFCLIIYYGNLKNINNMLVVICSWLFWELKIIIERKHNSKIIYKNDRFWKTSENWQTWQALERKVTGVHGVWVKQGTPLQSLQIAKASQEMVKFQTWLRIHRPDWRTSQQNINYINSCYFSRTETISLVKR